MVSHTPPLSPRAYYVTIATGNIQLVGCALSVAGTPMFFNGSTANTPALSCAIINKYFPNAPSGIYYLFTGRVFCEFFTFPGVISTFTPGIPNVLTNPRSCRALFGYFPDLVTGTYWISASMVNTQSYCDTNGGWLLFMKLGANSGYNGFCWGSPQWTSYPAFNPLNLLDSSTPSGYEAKSQLYATMTDALYLKFTNSLGSVQVNFASPSSPRGLMTSTAVPFSVYPNFINWRTVFSADRAGSPIFMRGGVADTSANYATSFSCPRTNPQNAPQGCGAGNLCMFCFRPSNGNTCCGWGAAFGSCSTTASGDDIESGVGLTYNYCNDNNGLCSYNSYYSSQATPPSLWATFDCAGISNCNNNGICSGPNICTCNAGYTGAACNAFTCRAGGLNGCNNQGSCNSYETCTCNTNWGNNDCSKFTCASSANCNGHGSCSGGTCSCTTGWYGADCSVGSGASSGLAAPSCQALRDIAGQVSGNYYITSGSVFCDMTTNPVTTYTPGIVNVLTNPRSCKLLNALFPTLTSGVYYVTTGGVTAPTNTQAYCDMSGGWTVVLKLGSNTMCYGSTKWFDSTPYNPSNLLNSAAPSGYDAKSALFDMMTDVQTLKFTNTNGAAQVWFASAASPMVLMTSNAVPFSPYPSWSTWNTVFKLDRAGTPVFMRGGAFDLNGYATGNTCVRTNANAGVYGGSCSGGTACMFCFFANNQGPCGSAASLDDIATGLGQWPNAFCSQNPQSCSYDGTWSAGTTPVTVWASYDCNNVNQCSSNGRCVAANTCLCNAGWSGSTCNVPTCTAGTLNGCNGKGTCSAYETCTCDAHATGVGCASLACSSVNDCSGHGTCSSSSACTCNAGWYAADCSVSDGSTSALAAPSCQVIRDIVGRPISGNYYTTGGFVYCDMRLNPVVTITAGIANVVTNPRSCKQFSQYFPTLTSGAYYLTVLNTNIQAYCDLPAGWTLILKLGGNSMCYQSNYWTNGLPLNTQYLLDTTVPGYLASGSNAWDAKSALFDLMTDVQSLKFSNTNGNVNVSFASASSPVNLMTTQNIPFSPYPDFVSWRSVFSIDRAGGPIFVRGGAIETNGYSTFSCQRTNLALTQYGGNNCGQPCMFCFQAWDGTSAGSYTGPLNSCGAAATISDVQSGVGQGNNYCGSGQGWCSYVGSWSNQATPTIVWASYNCHALGECNGHGLCTAPNVCTCNSGWQGASCTELATQCAYATENNVATVTCPNGGLIQSINFASFGLPSGSCGAGFTVNPACANSLSMSIATAACYGKTSCSITASNGQFQYDPCSGLGKALALVVACPTSTYTCVTAADCTGHGTCNSGSCTCNSGWVGVDCSSATLPIGSASSAPGASCAAIKKAAPWSTDGVYWIQPSGVSSAFQAYCDMTTDGGGWQMCYTTNGEISMGTELTSSTTFGNVGYRSNCLFTPFNDIIVYSHTSNQRTYFKQTARQVFVINTVGLSQGSPTAFSTYGLWNIFGVGYGQNIQYQVGVCDNGAGGWSEGIMVSGYTSSCYKGCGSWCADSSSLFWRAQGGTNGYLGACFDQNGSTNCPANVISFGIRQS